MGTKVQIGNSIHEVPEYGEQNWGPKATDVILALVEGLSNVVGPADILIKEALLANNQSTRQPINGFKFDTTIVQNMIANAVVIRTFPEILSIAPKQDTIVIEGASFQGDVEYSVRYTGSNTGVKIFVRPDGQVEYTSTDVENTDSVFIKFYAKAITSDET